MHFVVVIDLEVDVRLRHKVKIVLQLVRRIRFCI